MGTAFMIKGKWREHAARASLRKDRSNGLNQFGTWLHVPQKERPEVLVLKLEVAEAVRWRGQSCCTNERELQLQLYASHFRTGPSRIPACELCFMPLPVQPPCSVIDLWLLVRALGPWDLSAPPSRQSRSRNA